MANIMNVFNFSNIIDQELCLKGNYNRNDNGRNSKSKAFNKGKFHIKINVENDN